MSGLFENKSTKQVLYLGRLFCGKEQDFAILKAEFDPKRDWFSHHHVRIDLGYLGFDKQYSCGDFSLPIKSSKNKPLSEEAKSSNQILASQRIVIEHVIGGMKRYRVLVNRVRSRSWFGYDTRMEVCAGLWNFYLTN